MSGVNGQVSPHVPLHRRILRAPTAPAGERARVVILREPMRASTREQLMRDGVKPGEYARRDQPSVDVNHACGELAC
jgi:hypothetical protein